MVRAVGAMVTVLAMVAVPGRAAARGCSEVSDVVGLARCRRFGAYWDGGLPTLTISVGARALSYTPRHGSRFDGTFGPQKRLFQFSGAEMDGGVVPAYGIDFRVTGAVTPYVYLGLEVGGGVSRATRSFNSGGTHFDSSEGLNVGELELGAIVGARLPLGRFSLRAEVLAGGAQMTVEQLVARDGESGPGKAYSLAWLLQPRIAGDVWATPWMAVSVFGGMSNFDSEALTAGLALSFHLRSFDGRFLF